jgi:formate hydrogenlyase subunit 3/multisubunit Na+/H+ antiporter MnhD subunit
MNGFRLGLFQPLQAWLGSDPSHRVSFLAKNMLAASLSGGLGAVVGAPLYLLKTRLQVSGLYYIVLHCKHTGMYMSLVLSLSFSLTPFYCVDVWENRC